MHFSKDFHSNEACEIIDGIDDVLHNGMFHPENVKDDSVWNSLITIKMMVHLTDSNLQIWKAYEEGLDEEDGRLREIIKAHKTCLNKVNELIDREKGKYL